MSSMLLWPLFRMSDGGDVSDPSDVSDVGDVDGVDGVDAADGGDDGDGVFRFDGFFRMVWGNHKKRQALKPLTL